MLLNVSLFFFESIPLWAVLAIILTFAILAFTLANLKQKKYLKALTESSKEFQAVIRSMQDAILVTDPEGGITYWGYPAVIMFGWNESDVLKQNVFELLVPGTETAAVREKLAESAEKTGVAAGKNLLCVKLATKYGLTFPAEISMNSVERPGGERIVWVVRDITQRKQFDRQILKLNNALEQTADIIFITDILGSIEYVNQSFLDVTGYSRVEVIGQNPRILKSGKMPAGYYRRLFQKLSAGEVFSGEVVNRCKDGREFTYLQTVTPLKNREGRISNYISTGKDITRQKHIERTIEHQKNILDLFVKYSPAAIAMFDRDMNYLMVSRRWYQDYEIDFDLIGRNHYEVFSAIGQSHSDWLEIHQRCLNGAIAKKERDFFLRKNGNQEWIRWEIHPWEKQPGEVGGIIMFSERITHNVLMEEELLRLNTSLEERVVKRTRELEKSEQRFKALIDQASAGIYIMSAEGKFTNVNRQACRNLGYSKGELLAMSIRDICPEMKEPGRQLLTYRLENQESPVSFEGTYQRKDGTSYPVELRIGSINLANETVLIGIERDLTEIKKAEQLKEKSITAAEEANRAKSSFLANMSHEIRTPINAITGLLYLMSRTELSDKQDNYLQKIRTSTTNLLNVINDVLDFSKIEAGKMKIEQVAFILEDVLKNISDINYIKAYEKGLEIYFIVAPEIPNFLEGDPLRLNQILNNLVSNAIKFTNAGEIKVVIDCLKQTAEAVQLKFSVIDTGIGMSEAEIARLFKPFSQADDSTTRKYGGTGLGLSISKKIVDLLQGELGVESERGRGSTFYCIFDFKRAKAYQEATVSPNVYGLQILCIDNVLSSRKMLANIFDALSFRFTFSSFEKQELHKKMKIRAYDLIVLHLQPGKINELTLYKEAWSAVQPEPARKVILITPFDGADGLVKLPQVDALLFPPVQKSQFFNKVLELFTPEVEDEKKTTETAPVFPVSDRQDYSRILLVEDNDINQQVAGELLAGRGFEVEYANNGLEAIRQIEAGGYDLVLMDIQMPELDGYEATKYIRRKLKKETLPVIAMTANTSRADIQDALNAGMNDHVAKPIVPETLFTKIHKWLPVTGSSGEVEPSPVTETLKTEDFLKLKGINYREGLKRVANNTELYKKILLKFKNNNQGAVDQIQAALEDNRLGELQSFLHKLKGVTGNIGAFSINQYVSEFDSFLKSSAVRRIKRELPGFRQSFREVMASLAEFEASVKEPGTEGAHKLSAEELEALLPTLEEIERLLQAGSIDAVHKWRKVAEPLKSLSGELCQNITHRIEIYDFDSALVELTKLKKELISNRRNDARKQTNDLNR